MRRQAGLLASMRTRCGVSTVKRKRPSVTSAAGAATGSSLNSWHWAHSASQPRTSRPRMRRHEGLMARVSP